MEMDNPTVRFHPMSTSQARAQTRLKAAVRLTAAGATSPHGSSSSSRTQSKDGTTSPRASSAPFSSKYYTVRISGDPLGRQNRNTSNDQEPQHDQSKEIRRQKSSRVRLVASRDVVVQPEPAPAVPAPGPAPAPSTNKSWGGNRLLELAKQKYINMRLAADKRISILSAIIAFCCLLSCALLPVIFESEWNPDTMDYDRQTTVAYALQGVVSFLTVVILLCLFLLQKQVLASRYPDITFPCWKPLASKSFLLEAVVNLLHIPPNPVARTTLWNLVVFFRYYAVVKLLRFHPAPRKLRQSLITSGMDPNQSTIFAVKNVVRQDPWTAISVVIILTVPVFGYALYVIDRANMEFNSVTQSAWYIFNLMAIQNVFFDTSSIARPVLIPAELLGVLVVSFLVSSLNQALQLDATQTAALAGVVMAELEAQTKVSAARYIRCMHRWSKDKRNHELKRDMAVCKKRFLQAKEELATMKKENKDNDDLSQLVVKLGYSLKETDEKVTVVKDELRDKLVDLKAELVDNTAALRVLTVEKYGILDGKNQLMVQDFNSHADWARQNAAAQSTRMTQIDEKLTEILQVLGEQGRLDSRTITERERKRKEAEQFMLESMTETRTRVEEQRDLLGGLQTMLSEMKQQGAAQAQQLIASTLTEIRTEMDTRLTAVVEQQKQALAEQSRSADIPERLKALEAVVGNLTQQLAHQSTVRMQEHTAAREAQLRETAAIVDSAKFELLEALRNATQQADQITALKRQNEELLARLSLGSEQDAAKQAMEFRAHTTRLSEAVAQVAATVSRTEAQTSSALAVIQQQQQQQSSLLGQLEERELPATAAALAIIQQEQQKQNSLLAQLGERELPATAAGLAELSKQLKREQAALLSGITADLMQSMQSSAKDSLVATQQVGDRVDAVQRSLERVVIGNEQIQTKNYGVLSTMETQVQQLNDSLQANAVTQSSRVQQEASRTENLQNELARLSGVITEVSQAVVSTRDTETKRVEILEANQRDTEELLTKLNNAVSELQDLFEQLQRQRPPSQRPQSQPSQTEDPPEPASRGRADGIVRSHVQKIETTYLKHSKSPVRQ